jgi:hypothetical protein
MNSVGGCTAIAAAFYLSFVPDGHSGGKYPQSQRSEKVCGEM